MPPEVKDGNSCAPQTILYLHPRMPPLTKQCFQSAPSLLGDKTLGCIHLHLPPFELHAQDPAPVAKAKNIAIVLHRWMRMTISQRQSLSPVEKAKKEKFPLNQSHLLRKKVTETRKNLLPSQNLSGPLPSHVSGYSEARQAVDTKHVLGHTRSP